MGEKAKVKISVDQSAASRDIHRINFTLTRKFTATANISNNFIYSPKETTTHEIKLKTKFSKDPCKAGQTKDLTLTLDLPTEDKFP